MKNLVFAALLVAAAGVANAAEAKKSAGTVFTPEDATSFEVTTADVVRFTGPGLSTGQKMTVKVTSGKAKVTKRQVMKVVNGKNVPGGDRIEFDVKPQGAGTVKVSVTGGKESKDYEFEVK